MSVLRIGGRRYAAGLYWLERGGARATARTARRLGRPFYVHAGERTGFAADIGSPGGPDPAGLGPEGLPALALALGEHIDGGFWMALVADDAVDGAGGGEARWALVKARDGAVLADGDEVFGDRAAALEAFERARSLGWALYATPAVMAHLERADEVTPLEPAALGEAAARAGGGIALTRAAPARRNGPRPARAVAGIAVVAVLAGAWFGRDALLSLILPPEPAPQPAALQHEPELDVVVDGGALIAACRRALIERSPFMPAWRIERIACAARFADPELTGLRPELAGRPVLLVRWRHVPGHAEAMHRRLAETHLSRWHAAQVAGGRAWAVATLGPVLRPAGAAAPAFLDLRRAVDRAFGARGARIGYARGAGGAWTVRIDHPGPLTRLGPLVGGIPGLEIAALSRGADGGWRLEGRPAVPERMTASRLRALGAVAGSGSVSGAPAASTHTEEVPHGTEHRDVP